MLHQDEDEVHALVEHLPTWAHEPTVVLEQPRVLVLGRVDSESGFQWDEDVGLQVHEDQVVGVACDGHKKGAHLGTSVAGYGHIGRAGVHPDLACSYCPVTHVQNSI